MTEHDSLRHELVESSLTVLSRLPSLGKLMIVMRDDAATHERIGNVERVRRNGDTVFCVGQAHDFSIDTRIISSVVTDRSGRMKDKVLPKIEFRGGNGELIFSVVGLDGIRKFDFALEGLKSRPVASSTAKPSSLPPSSGDDVASRLLNTARTEEAEISIEMHRPGATQRWRGIVPEINPAMGFINIITSDFHLHLRGGAVHSWQQKEVDGADRIELTAIGKEGQMLGLVLRGPRNSFGHL